MNAFLITLMVLYTISTLVYCVKLGVEIQTEGTAWALSPIVVNAGLLVWTLYVYSQSYC